MEEKLFSSILLPSVPKPKLHTPLGMKFQFTLHNYSNLRQDMEFKITDKIMINPKEEMQKS